MRRMFYLLMLFILLSSRPAAATYTLFRASGSITRLDQATYHLSINGGLWSDDPLLHPAYPLGAYTVNSAYELSGPFGTPFNPEGGMGYELHQNFAAAWYMTWRYAGLGWFNFDFTLPNPGNSSRLFMDLTIYSDIWQWVMDSPYDQFMPVGTLTGSGTVFADLPTIIGGSNPIQQTPEPSPIALILAGSAALLLRTRSRLGRAFDS
jgi:hypothetical protein